MRYYLSKILPILLALISPIAAHPLSQANDSLLKVLDSTIAESSEYCKIRERSAQKIRESITPRSTLAEQYDAADRLFKVYYAYQYDSVVHYLNRKIELSRLMADSAKFTADEIMRARINASIGAFTVARDILSTITKTDLDSVTLVNYLETSAYLYENMSSNSNDSEYREDYSRMSRHYVDHLMKIVSPDSPLYKQYLCKKLYNEGNLTAALKISDDLISSEAPGSINYASYAYSRSKIYEALGNDEKMMHWLILSAVSDLRSAIRDNASLSLIAQRLYDNGEIKRAYNYISKSMDDAIDYNTPYRKMQLSGFLHIIDQSSQTQLNQRHKEIVTLTIAVAVLLIITAAAFIYTIFLLKRKKRLAMHLQAEKEQTERLSERLARANEIKEQSIKTFLELSSADIYRLSEYRRQVTSKLNARRYNELLELSQSTDFSSREADEFYHNFDEAVLKIFPGFVDEFNTLLRDDERIVLKKPDTLTPELRIYALIRLGINSSNDIARLLRYSMSTIYNYRMKMRRKVKDPDSDLDMLVMEILS